MASTPDSSIQELLAAVSIKQDEIIDKLDKILNAPGVASPVTIVTPPLPTPP